MTGQPPNAAERSTPDTSELTLSALVREALDEHPTLASPAELADKFLAKVPKNSERSFLSKLLRGYVSEQLRHLEGVPTSELDPDAAWLGLLRDRVPTAEGYRFLADADASALSEGAQRRRSMAANLQARATVYEAIAEQITKAGVDTAGELAQVNAAEAVQAVHDPLRELAQLPAAEVVERLWNDPKALRIAVVAHARRNIPAAVDAALQLPEVADRWHSTLQAEIARRSAPPPGEGTLRRAERDALIDVREQLRASGARLKGQSDTTVEQIESLPPHAMIQRLLTRRRDLEQVALADARGRTPEHVAQALRQPEVLPSLIAALETLLYNLDRQVETQRGGEHRPLPRTKVTSDRSCVAARLRQMRQVHAQNRVVAEYKQAAFNTWEQSVIKEHKPEIVERHHAAMAEHGLTFPPNMPKKGIVAFAVQHQLLSKPPDDVARLIELSDAQFAEIVGNDVGGSRPQPLLRSDWLLDRWRHVLVQHKDTTEQRRAATDDEDLRRRMTRFVMAVNTALSEQRRLELTLRDRIAAEVHRLDIDRPRRWELWDEICRDVIAAHRRSEFSP